MKQEMYMFGTILMIMTLISALGGAIRYEENFYNEIFDLLDEDAPVEGSNFSDLADNSMAVPQNNDESVIREAPIVEEEVEEVEDVMTAPPTVMETPVMETPVMEGYAEEVEAYEENQYAAI